MLGPLTPATPVNRPPRRVVLLVGALALAIVAGLVLVFIRFVTPSAPESEPLVLDDFMVTASASPTGTVSLGARITVGTQVAGSNVVTSVELWDGARLLTQQSNRRDSSSMTASLAWVADVAGPHLLYVRATDSTGRTAASGPIMLDVAYRSGGGQRVKVNPSTQGSMSSDSGATVTPITRTPDTRASDLIAASMGTWAKVDPATGKATLPAVKSESSRAIDEPGPTALDGDVIVTAPAEGTAQGGTGNAPGIQVDGCLVTLTRSASGSVAHAGPGRAGFVQIAERGSSSLSLAELAPGTHVFLEQTAQGVSNPVSVTVPQRCGASRWQGDTTLIGGTLTLPRTVTPGAGLYAYVSVDGQPWVRVPSDPNRTLNPAGHRVDLSHELPLVPTGSIRVEAWEQKGTAATLIGSGEGSASIGKVNGLSFVEDVLTLTIEPAEGTDLTSYAGGSRKFVWHTLSRRVNGVVWQVLAEPLSSANHDLYPLGILTTGYAESSGAGGTPEGMTGTFTVPIGDLPLPGTWTALGGNRLAPGGQSKATKVTDLTASITSGLLAQITGMTQTGDVWVRAIGFHGFPSRGQEATMLPVASSALGMNAGPPPVVLPVDLQITSLSIQPRAASVPEFLGCVRVTQVPQWWNNPNDPHFKSSGGLNDLLSEGLLNQFTHASFPDVGTYCWVPPAEDDCGWLECAMDAVGDGLEAIASVLAKAWDAVAAIYNGLVSLVVDVLAYLNPVCRIMEAADSPGVDECNSITEAVSRVAVSAVLASFGLPPSLPTSSELKSMAEGDLIAWAVEGLKQLGVPCDSLHVESDVAAIAQAAGAEIPQEPDGSIDGCAAAVRVVIRETREQIKRTTYTTLAGSLNRFYYPVDGFEMIPEPLGRAGVIGTVIEASVASTAETVPYQIQVRVDLDTVGLPVPPPYRGGLVVLSRSAESAPGRTLFTSGYIQFTVPSRDGVEPVAPEGLPIRGRIVAAWQVQSLSGQLEGYGVYQNPWFGR